YFKGYIDEVRIYDRRLTDNDVAALYAATIPEPCTLAILAAGGLVAVIRKRKA
ncbi:MAG: PEP-CTERM sorting domain-containing protein, partial [Phycisphaerales bacterium]|nr:PEP-CTERM sorting domain-containing protein [Phycisphaerales bacterium]